MKTKKNGTGAPPSRSTVFEFLEGEHKQKYNLPCVAAGPAQGNLCFDSVLALVCARAAFHKRGPAAGPDVHLERVQCAYFWTISFSRFCAGPWGAQTVSKANALGDPPWHEKFRACSGGASWKVKFAAAPRQTTTAISTSKC